MNKTIEHIVTRLRDASHAYYETGTSLMTDDEYDDLLEQLRSLAPNHAYFAAVGAPVTDGAVRLPIPMPSLRKVKPDSVGSWGTTYPGPWIASDKLDGISALWVPALRALYLRGDGLVGQDVSAIVPHIQGLVGLGSVMVRGELITPKGVITDTLARSWVNGQLHQKTPNPADLAKIQFVAYSVYTEKPMTRAQQMEWLKREKFIPVPHALIKTVDELGPRLIQQRENGPYEIDGLVLGQAAAIPEGLDAKAALPRDAVAFKMPLADQKARALVVAVHWASSMGNLWIPRIEIQPVTIGTASITYATGHNAKFIKDNAIGPGAVIILRRSGDVIPTVEAVVSAAPGGAEMPCGSSEPQEGTWAWDERGTHAVDTRGVVTTEKHALFLVDSLNVFDIDGVSTKNAAKLVEGGFNDLAALWGATEASLVGVVGTALGAKLFQQLHNKLPVASPEQWIAAYQGWPRGFGKSRIAALLECGPVEMWPTLKTPPKGIGRETFDSIIGCVDGWIAWRGGFKFVSTSVTGKRIKPTSIVQVEAAKPIQKKGAFVMTGFRDKELEARLASAGWVTHDTVKSDTTVLIVADESKMGSSKVAAAEKKGVRIILRKDVDQLL